MQQPHSHAEFWTLPHVPGKQENEKVHQAPGGLAFVTSRPCIPLAKACDIQAWSTVIAEKWELSLLFLESYMGSFPETKLAHPFPVRNTEKEIILFKLWQKE